MDRNHFPGNIIIENDCQDVRIGPNAYNGSGPYVSDSGVGTMGVIKPATLQNGWVAYGAGDESLQFIKSESGLVTLYGAIKDGTSTNGTEVCELPAGFRPAKIVRAPMLGINSGTPVPGEITVESDGTTTITYVSGCQTLYANMTFAAANLANAVSLE